MADDKPDEKQTESTLKKWMHEVLDERDAAKAAADKEIADREAADAEKRRTTEPLSYLRSFIGI